jgi:drug/metabolite transporter (DMT)-like permease
LSEHSPNNQDFSFGAAIFTAFLCAVFGASTVAIKISLSGVGVFTTAGLRAVLASVGILLWAAATRQSLKIEQGQILQFLILALISVLELSLLYAGINKSNASRGSLLMNLQPFFVLFLAHYFIPGDRITKRKVIGLFMGFLGVTCVFLEKESVTADFRIGEIMVLGHAFLWAAKTIYIKRIMETCRPYCVVVYPMLASAPVFFLQGFLWDGAMISDLSLAVVLSLLFQGLVTVAFGFVAWYMILQSHGAASMHSFVFLVPVTGVLLGGLMLGEPITFRILLALLFVVSGLLVVHFKLKRQGSLSLSEG